jgi:uncharacterized protein
VIVPDANLLLYAYDLDSPFHGRARAWWESCLGGREAVGLTHPTLFAFLRIATSARVFAAPMSLAEAAGHVEEWLATPVAQVLLPVRDHAARVVALLGAAGSAGGNLVTDAQIAELALSRRAVVHTADRDFLRFPGLRCLFPLDD